tara:strand:- start:2631 stop:2819 length:189 start_codon:yes stop_codon:yes gene_type:complete
MSKQTEDTLMAVFLEVEKLGLKKEFDVQLEKMKKQSKHKWKDISFKYEYALKRIKENHENNE